jgi:hypothetical protein
MCIQKQHRVWSAEAALGNAQTLPEVTIPDKYPQLKQEEKEEEWSEYHPKNLAKERRLLTWFLEQAGLERFPAASRSKYWATAWEEWLKLIQETIARVKDEYPTDGIAGKPAGVLALYSPKLYSEQFQRWYRELENQGHPYAKLLSYSDFLDYSTEPPSPTLLELYRQEHREILEVCQRRLDTIGQIEQEMQQDQERYEAEVAQRKALTANPIPPEIGLLSRYESHNSKQLQIAIAHLQNLQQEREGRGSIGSFGQNIAEPA